uniref:SS18 N-terminal domain-containing protein n=1 Tax=Daphnia galeata TaxID=27404 RepID=A0A8J2W6M6_9CRUS|nr:unnamed protein product [Daphnia galeata]
MSLTFAQRGRPPSSPAQIQKLLDENSQHIMTIQDYQARGKTHECLQVEQILHRNLVYLASVADPAQNIQTLLPAPQGMPNTPGNPPQASDPNNQDSASPAPPNPQQGGPQGPPVIHRLPSQTSLSHPIAAQQVHQSHSSPILPQQQSSQYAVGYSHSQSGSPASYHPTAPYQQQLPPVGVTPYAHSHSGPPHQTQSPSVGGYWQFHPGPPPSPQQQSHSSVVYTHSSAGSHPPFHPSNCSQPSSQSYPSMAAQQSSPTGFGYPHSYAGPAQQTPSSHPGPFQQSSQSAVSYPPSNSAPSHSQSHPVPFQQSSQSQSGPVYPPYPPVHSPSHSGPALYPPTVSSQTAPNQQQWHPVGVTQYAHSHSGPPHQTQLLPFGGPQQQQSSSVGTYPSANSLAASGPSPVTSHQSRS